LSRLGHVCRTLVLAICASVFALTAGQATAQGPKPEPAPKQSRTQLRPDPVPTATTKSPARTTTTSGSSTSSSSSSSSSSSQKSSSSQGSTSQTATPVYRPAQVSPPAVSQPPAPSTSSAPTPPAVRRTITPVSSSPAPRARTKAVHAAKKNARRSTVPARAIAAADAARRIVLQNLWAPVSVTKASAASASPNSKLLAAGGLLLVFLVLAEIGFLKLSAGLLRRSAAL
jgi:S-DNA-T family DNA segregation ATPase FtsK/SpoIIIE